MSQTEELKEQFKRNAELAKTIPKNETSSRNTHCNRCGRLFADCGGRASRLIPAKYNCADSNAGQYCRACFYEFNAGYRGRY